MKVWRSTDDAAKLIARRLTIVQTQAAVQVLEEANWRRERFTGVGADEHRELPRSHGQSSSRHS